MEYPSNNTSLVLQNYIGGRGDIQPYNFRMRFIWLCIQEVATLALTSILCCVASLIYMKSVYNLSSMF